MTPLKVIDKVKYCLGAIDIDVASNSIAQHYIQATDFYGLDVNKNALYLPWKGRIYCNPPYSAKNINAFVDKFKEEILIDNIDRAVILTNTSSDSMWYHTLLQYSTCALLWRGRIKFLKIMDGKAYEKWEGQVSKEKGLGKIGNAPRYLNTLFYYDRHDDIEPFLLAFKDCGTFVQRIDKELF
jgi:hypothetical protein